MADTGTTFLSAEGKYRPRCSESKHESFRSLKKMAVVVIVKKLCNLKPSTSNDRLKNGLNGGFSKLDIYVARPTLRFRIGLWN